jgi:SWI/SNF-related matrix-associated actin-dependent regulator of chromatin subfamily D
MLGFSTSPVDFINDLIASQVRDYKVMTSETGKDEEEERHSSYYYQPLVEEAVQVCRRFYLLYLVLHI